MNLGRNGAKGDTGRSEKVDNDYSLKEVVQDSKKTKINSPSTEHFRHLYQ